VTTAERFEAFLLEFQDMVYATALRLLGNSAEAEDVAQTVFLKAFEHFGELDGNPSAPGWLKTVATHECLNHLARYRKRWSFFAEAPENPRLRQPSTGLRLPRAGVEGQGFGGQALSDLEREDEFAALDAALRALPASQRVPIVLFHFDELSYQQIAERLSISISKVKTDIHRGREALRAVLSPKGDR
jgi:RNA polymerase sigma-70 factor, ECF subfamily